MVSDIVGGDLQVIGKLIIGDEFCCTGRIDPVVVGQL
jgi:hypothetical protein